MILQIIGKNNTSKKQQEKDRDFLSDVEQLPQSNSYLVSQTGNLPDLIREVNACPTFSWME
jgi:hypothetical protein